MKKKKTKGEKICRKCGKRERCHTCGKTMFGYGPWGCAKSYKLRANGPTHYMCSSCAD